MINFALLEAVTKTTTYQASKQIQHNESNYKEVLLTDSTTPNLSTLSVRGYVNLTTSLSSNQTLMQFDLGNDVIDTSKGVYLTIRAKANFSKMPQDIKICAYEYDSSNSIKRLGTYDNSYMGEMIDYVTLSEGTVIASNASYCDFTFDISSYITKLQAAENNTLKLIFGLDYEQIEAYQTLYQNSGYDYATTDLSFTIYPNSAAVNSYTGTVTVFDGAAPRLTYKKTVK